MNEKEARQFVCASSLLLVLQGKMSSKKATFRLRRAVKDELHGKAKANRVDAPAGHHR